MNGELKEQPVDNQLSKLFSTYGLITAERILGKYRISLPQNELAEAIKSSFCFYHRLLQIPLKNVLNGIVLQQAEDYHIYVQKLLIDYLLSGESGKSDTSPGALTRVAIEEERTRLVDLGDDFQKQKMAHDALIARSQSILIRISGEWNVALETATTLSASILKDADINVKKNIVQKAINYSIIHCDLNKLESQDNNYYIIEKINEVLKSSLTMELKEKLMGSLSGLIAISINFESEVSEFFDETKEMSQEVRSYRSQFYDTIIRVTEQLNLLSEYSINQAQDVINREPLYFDKTIGG